ncbi:High-affinity nickel transport protein nic1 [Neolecta irregularis DAH-3]|uniref:Nickel/cobalt efflux system n=1 Tax=Neolecta irregularis (strain DAH-3) TaxID=1198029 RepID=A0A1U7LKS6_NEOID|nr:High-affinity nickel transport protein nic1 [Neolecta irregularis DAH-3]|eukprot:OLL23260.1 High-affinity nickel transport protein nic1 [Neolecta irregularis DAH-3]
MACVHIRRKRISSDLARNLSSAAILSYTLGLRHGFDADHITAIDLTTRKLIALDQQPVTVGLFFSLGHSTVVAIVCVIVAATSTALADRFDTFGTVGGIIGVSVSCVFLFLIAISNIIIVRGQIRQMNRLLRNEAIYDDDILLGGGGTCARTINKVFNLIDAPWKMYPRTVLFVVGLMDFQVGFLFGLGFDTSTEIALLGIASIKAAAKTSLWLILFFPALFTCGMCLIDTTDGALMSMAYSSNSFTTDPRTRLYYSIVLTILSISVALVIAFIQLLSLILNVAHPTGRFWDGVETLGDRYDIVGGIIIGLFIFVGILSVIGHRLWKDKWSQPTYAGVCQAKNYPENDMRNEPPRIATSISKGRPLSSGEEFQPM